MEEPRFQVNSGNVPPPSQSTNLLSHQLGNFASSFHANNIRRKTKEVPKNIPKLKLERILGLTSTSSNILATSNDLIAYAAGAVVVIYNSKRNKQVALLYPPLPEQQLQQQQQQQQQMNGNNNINVNSSSNNNIINISPLGGSSNNNISVNEATINPAIINDEKKSKIPASTRAKPISCLAFSPDGNYLAAGEMGHQPRILIWDIKEKKLVREFKSHKFGVLSLSFSPNMRYIVSVGFQHDGYLYVWDWKKGTKLAGNKVTSRVNAVSFSKDGSYFVTAGLRHVKFWYLDAKGRIPKRGNLSSRETQVLDGRSGILGVLRDANFVDVACDRSSNNTGYTYFITDIGILCIFKEGRVIDKWVDLQVKNAFSIAVSSKYVICTCSDGVIRLFEPVTLKYAGILPKPHPLGVDISLFTSTDMIKSTDSACHPDAVAMAYDESTQRVISVYSDKSLYVWDIRDLNKIGKYRSFIFHSDCVWGVEPCPNIVEKEDSIPFNSFATFSGDGTIRIWNLDTNNATPISSNSTSPLSPPSPQLPSFISPSNSTTSLLRSTTNRNIYSKELIKMIYVDQDAAEYSKIKCNSADILDESDFGIRCIKMSSDGNLLASGDRSGNLRVHDMRTWKILTYQEAHDSEILSIDLTTPIENDKPSLLATASRDRLLHIFDIKSNFQLVQSLDDHSSSITAVKLTKDSTKLISCGADKGIIFRHLKNPVTPFVDYLKPRPFATYHNYSGRSTVFDMSLDINDRYVATVTGERKLYVLSTESGKPFRICKPETMDEAGKFAENSGGSLTNIDLDPFSGTYAVTSGSDKCIRLFDLTNSTCIEKVCAHSELITSVKFVCLNAEQDGLRIISTCSDGTIFIWKVGKEIISKMTARASERDSRLKKDQAVRVRRVSNNAVIKPTASISQMIRQGERRTFSTMSTQEQKYDDLYKKISLVEPINKTPKSPQRKLSTQQEKIGKLDRLYNGLPTSSNAARERTNSFVTPPSNFVRQPITRNPILRRAVSRDALLNNKESNRKSPTRANYIIKNNNNTSKPPLNNNANKKHNSMFDRRVSDPLQRLKKSDCSETLNETDGEEAMTHKQNQQIEEEDEGVDVEEEDEEDNDNDEEGEEEDEEEEEIIFTPEQEKVIIPFQVSTHRNSEKEDYEDERDLESGRNTPDSDGTLNTQLQSNDSSLNNEEEENEDDDDVINRNIIAREPPRVTTSLSRTTSTINKRPKCALLDDTPPVPQLPSIIMPNEQETNNPAFKEIQRKLDKAAKRQSITARFLSSIGGTNITTTTRPSLDHVLNSFQDLSNAGSNKQPAALSLTIDVVPAITAEVTTKVISPIEQHTNKEEDEEDPKLENALADLDGITILLDSVLEAYLSTVKSNLNKKSISIIENKLNSVVDKISKSIETIEPPEQKESPETINLLEKYSTLLLEMVENKINK